jgi:cytoskeleton protein RodZ
MDETSPGSIGERLRRRRESLGRSLKDVENATKIRVRYLEALEQDDVAALPAEVYALGFLRSYARYLGLEPEELVSAWRRLREPPPAAEVPTPPPAARPPRRSRAVHAPAPGGAARPGSWIAVVVGLVIVLVGIVALLHRGRQPTGAVASPPSVAAAPSPRHRHRATHRQHPSPASASSTPVVTQVSDTTQLVAYAVRTGPINLTLQFSGPCWVEVWVNGVTSNPYGHTYQDGQSLQVSGSQTVKVLLGNSGVVTAVLNGQSLGALGSGPVRYVEASVQS